ncbi:MAG: glycosyltransferase family 4 protein, partial [Anaerolineales bacterium]|nr:glycosyltransferase family 4 protein [Anaerolineales bacterium]
ALNWINYFIAAGHQVYLASTYICKSIPGLAALETIPVALSQVQDFATQVASSRGSLLRRVIPVGLRTRLRQWAGPYTLRHAAFSLRGMIERLQPDLVHAMRIPYEGMIAALAIEQLAPPRPPLLISIWGNDFTLHAPASPQMAHSTRRALESADALHTDCQRDQALARQWGFAANKPGIVLPGGGGIQMDVFFPPPENGQAEGAPVVINPRGFRSYVRNDTFFHAIPLVLAARPEVRFIGLVMAGEAQAQRWVQELGIGHAVDLLPRLERHQVADWMRKAQIVLSITTHDGTPNTLLEALACGCFPIAGELESLREWISPGVNGLLVDPGDPAALAQAILFALEHPDLRRQARQHNLHLVREKAEYGAVMAEASEFYQRLLASDGLKPGSGSPG